MENITLPVKNESRYITILFYFLQISFLFLFIYTEQPILVFGGLIFLIIAPFIIYSPFNILLFLIAYISILPSRGWGMRYSFFHYYVDWKILILILLAAFLILFIRNLYEKTWHIDIASLDQILIIFFIYSMLSLFWGLYKNTGTSLPIQDFYFIFLYSAYFLSRLLFQKEKLMRIFFIIFIIISVITSFEYILLTFSEMTFSNLFVTRVPTRQPHLAQISIPILVAVFFFTKNRIYKLGALILFIPNFLMVVLSQQRALWLGIILSIIIVTFLYYLRHGFNIYQIFKFFLIMIVSILFLILTLIILDKYLHLNLIFTGLSRVSTFFTLSQDFSVNVRISEIKIALKQWEKNIFFGAGLGAKYSRILVSRGEGTLDNSYVFVLWKLGIVGLFLFLLFYLKNFYHNLKTFWQSKLEFEQIIITSIFAGISGIMLIAFTNMSIIRYRYNIIWAVLIGISENLYLKYFKEENA